MQDAKQPNHRLRRAREARGWTREDMADQLFCLCPAKPRGRGDINANMIGRWERGEHAPSPFWQKKLAKLFEVTLEQLGLISPCIEEDAPVASSSMINVQVDGQQSVPGSNGPLSTIASSPSLSTAPTIIFISPQTQAVDALLASRAVLPGMGLPSQGIDNHTFSAYAQYQDEREQQLSIHLLLGAGHIAPLLDEGWSPEDVLQMINSFAKVVQTMPHMTRQQFLRQFAGAAVAAIVGDIPDFSKEKHVTEGNRAQLHQALSDSIVSGWQSFPSASNSQILAVGQAQLSLVQQSDSLLYPSVRPYLYTGAYGLIGIALHFQARDSDALRSHKSGYIAALATGEPWYVAQSLICQSDCYHALGQFGSANQAIEEALRILETPRDDAQVCARAHLLTCWADNAMMTGDYRTAQEKLEAAGEYIDNIAPNEEFDKASWHMLTGKYGLLTKNYRTALSSFKDSLAQLPEQWTLRRAMSTIGLAKAYARLQERDKSLFVAETLIPMVQTINAKMTNDWFVEYLQQDMQEVFPGDEHVLRFMTDTYKRLPQLATNA